MSRLIHYEFPLRKPVPADLFGADKTGKPAVIAILALPVDLTKEEADRIACFVASLVVPWAAAEGGS